MVLAPVLVSKLIHKQSTDFQNPGDNDMSQNSRIILRYIVVQIEIKKKKDKKSIVQIHKINLIVEMKKNNLRFIFNKFGFIWIEIGL